MKRQSFLRSLLGLLCIKPAIAQKPASLIIFDCAFSRLPTTHLLLMEQSAFLFPPTWRDLNK